MSKVLPTEEVSIWVLTFFPESSQGLGLGTCPARPVQPASADLLALGKLLRSLPSFLRWRCDSIYYLGLR